MPRVNVWSFALMEGGEIFIKNSALSKAMTKLIPKL